MNKMNANFKWAVPTIMGCAWWTIMGCAWGDYNAVPTIILSRRPWGTI
jgi:hypothetical protein